MIIFALVLTPIDWYYFFINYVLVYQFIIFVCLFFWLPLKFLYKLIYLIFYFANNLATLFRNSLFLMYFLCFFFFFAYYITCDILSCFRTFFFETKHISFHYVMLKDIINFLSNIVSFKVKLRTDINKKKLIITKQK